MNVNINPWDKTTVYENTTPLSLGDIVTVTIPGPLSDLVIKDEIGAVKLFEVVENGGRLGINYDNPDFSGFVPFSDFAPSVIFAKI